MHALQNYIAGWWNHRMSEINIPPYLLQFFDQRQSCNVLANLQTANVIGKLTTNLENTLIEKYSEIGLKSGEHILNVYDRFFTQIYLQNIAKFNSNQRIMVCHRHEKLLVLHACFQIMLCKSSSRCGS